MYQIVNFNTLKIVQTVFVDNKQITNPEHRGQSGADSLYLEEANQVMKSLNFFYLVALQRLKVERSAGLRKQKQLKRKLDNQDVHTGNIQYHNIHKVNKQTSSKELSNKFQNLPNGDGHQKTSSNSLSSNVLRPGGVIKSEGGGKRMNSE